MFSPPPMICLHLRCYITNHIHLIMCILHERKLLNIKGFNINIVFNVLPIYFSFWLKHYFDMCFDHLIKFNLCITSSLYYRNHMITTHLYLYMNVLSDIGICLSKQKRKNLNTYDPKGDGSLV